MAIDPRSALSSADASLEKLAALKEHIRRLCADNTALRSAADEAGVLLDEAQAERKRLLDLNHRLASAAADSAELIAEIQSKNEALKKTNQELSLANARAAELIAEIESKNQRIDTLNKTLATANATAAELVAELELRRTELEQANRALREANEEKAHILGVIAHDLRSGIGGMSGIADLLAEEVKDASPDVFDFIRLLREESHRLLNLLSALLDMSRIEQGRLNLHLEIADLRGLVADCLAYHAHFASNKNQRLVNDRCEEELRCAFDPVRLRQVLDNLLSNAVKYSPPGAEIRVCQRVEDKLVVVEILDQGPGLTAADEQKVFRSFQKLSAQPTGGEDSHGLGLAIAKKVVESHHGKIWAKNRSDQRGAAFGFSLARRPA